MRINLNNELCVPREWQGYAEYNEEVTRAYDQWERIRCSYQRQPDATWVVHTRTPFLTKPKGNPKLAKGEDELPTFSMSLAHAWTWQPPPLGSAAWHELRMWLAILLDDPDPIEPEDVQINTCTWHTKQCAATCVGFNGHGHREQTKRARSARTLLWLLDPTAAETLVLHELGNGVRQYEQIGFRPNAFSNIQWPKACPSILLMDGVLPYDYTKEPIEKAVDIGNYRQTFSVTEQWDEVKAGRYLRRGAALTMVLPYRKHDPRPQSIMIDGEWWPVEDGDTTDDRWHRPHDGGFVWSLYPKGMLTIDNPWVQGGPWERVSWAS